MRAIDRVATTLVILAWCLVAGCSESPRQPAATAEDRTAHPATRGYLHGANLPWLNWGCDFGCGSDRGASSADSQSTLNATFAAADNAGLRVVRWWMFPGEPWQIQVQADGQPASLTPDVYTDIDAALDLAEQYDLYFVFVLFSAPGHLPDAWLSDPPTRDTLARSLAPLFAHYAAEPRIIAWEIVNEPEWDIRRGTVILSDVREFVVTLAGTIHANAHTSVTLGSATIADLGLWVGTGLDFYQAHWYDPMGPGMCARCVTYSELKTQQRLDAPVVIGEFYADPSVDAAARFQDFYDLGYAGAWPWSLLPGRTQDGFAIDFDAARRFLETNPAATLP